MAILGKPSIEMFSDLDQIETEGLKRVFDDIETRAKVEWRYLFPNVRCHIIQANPVALDLLDHLLVYDPRVRYTAEECLNHPYFNDFKRQPQKLCQETFDFSFDTVETTYENLRKAIYAETQAFQCKPTTPRGT